MSYEIVYSERIRNYCGFSGYKFRRKYIEKVFPKDIYNDIYDIEGTDNIIESLNINSTGFEENFLKEVFSIEGEETLLLSWRIGESFSKFFLKNEYKVRFYHNEIRDTKNIKSNPTGADLIGFIQIDQDTLFLFGEVKTSADRESPPRVIYGMIKQLEDLANQKKIRNNVISYLTFKTRKYNKDTDFRIDLKNALMNYKDNKFQLAGVLIRDTDPIISDLKPGFKSLRKKIDDKINTELLAFYIPVKMEEWHDLVANRGDTDGI